MGPELVRVERGKRGGVDVTRLVHRAVSVISVLIALASAGGSHWQVCSAQDELIERPGPPAVDNLEADENNDGLPDGWYNARDAKWISEGGAPDAGPHFVRFECKDPGRPARLSRAFGVDGRKTEAVVLGLWIRQSNVQSGERDGDEPGLMIDFLGDELRHLSRGTMGPWIRSVRDRWTRVAKRIPVPPGTKDAILSLGLMGATGTLDIDGLTIDLVARGGEETTNLIVNGGFELGDPSPAHWLTDNDAHRAFPGNRSPAALELSRARSHALSGVAIPVGQFQWLDVTVSVRCSGLRGAGGAAAVFFFVNDLGKPLPGADGANYFLNWADSSPWQVDQARVPVPVGATRAVLQFEKRDAIGWIRIDDVQVTGGPNPAAGAWTPYHTADETADWLAVPASKTIESQTALDVSFLLPRPAGALGFVTVKDGRLTWGNDGSRARFFGVALLPPTAFLPARQADVLAERLARSGVNLVRLGELDTALGPNRSLFDDTRDDTKAFDSEAVARLDHFIAALKSHGIYVALELQGKRRFRTGDGVTVPGLLPPGGGPAAVFDPTLRKLAIDSAKALLRHLNPETGLSLKDDPVLAWVTLTGEVTLFNMIDSPDSLPAAYAKTLQSLAEKARGGPGRRFWETVEAAHLKQMADALRKDGLRVPIAGVSHWRREPEFGAAQAGTGLDLIDDRLFWNPPPWVAPEKRSLLWAGPDTGLAGLAAMKRKPDRPYAVGQTCDVTQGAWSLPYEAADQILSIYSALAGDWDALVRRGIFLYPINWGEGPAGTVGGEDIFQIAEVANGSPHIYGLWPHAASLFLRGTGPRAERDRPAADAPAHLAAKNRRRSASGWDSARGRLFIDTAYTQGIAGWVDGESAAMMNLEFETNNSFAVLLATSVTNQPIATTKRLLVSAIARVEPTGFRWVDSWKREVGDPGRPPFLQEPVSARIVWRHKGSVRAFVLDNTGARTGEAKLEQLPGGDGVSLVIDGRTAAFHWELTAE
jgi:hypothetical protein